MSFTVATYNVLANAYIRPEWYPHTSPELLDPHHRIPALVEHLARLDCDLLCLQEVEDESFAAASERLNPLGYAGEFARKGRGKVDGCATFYRTGVFELVRSARLEYHDASGDEPNSGHVAQILLLKTSGRLLGVANTHLKWYPPGTPSDRQIGSHQIRELLDQRTVVAPEAAGWIVCGDLNVRPDSEVVHALTAAGFAYTHAGMSRAATCNPNRQAKMIDFIFHDRALCAEPLPLPEIHDDTPLPGPGHPSDHVPVVARMDWAW